MLNALVAPAPFRDLVEYPVVIALAAALRPPAPADSDAAWLDLALPLLLLVAIAVPHFLTDEAYRGLSESALVYAGGAHRLLLSPSDDPLRLGHRGDPAGHRPRSAGTPGAAARAQFFGVLDVAANKDMPMHILYHGTTEHGKQRLEADQRLVPQSYYAAQARSAMSSPRSARGTRPSASAPSVSARARSPAR